MRGVSVFILVVLFLFSLLLSPSRSLLLTLLLKLVAVLCCRPGEDARFLRGVSTKELGDAAAIRLSRDTGAVRTTVPGGSLEDTVKQQAATIHAQALKLHQLRRKQFFVRPEDISDSGGELLLRVCTWLCVEVCVSCTVMWLVFGA